MVYTNQRHHNKPGVEIDQCRCCSNILTESDTIYNIHERSFCDRYDIDKYALDDAVVCSYKCLQRIVWYLDYHGYMPEDEIPFADARK